MTDLLATLRRRNPGVRFATSKSGDTIGVWDAGHGRFIPVFSRLLSGPWAAAPHVLVNGRPMVEAGDWIE